MIEINELIMSLPDMTPEQGERLGNNVAECLLTSIPPGYEGGNIDSLSIRIQTSTAIDHGRLANDIAMQIRYQLLNR